MSDDKDAQIEALKRDVAHFRERYRRLHAIHVEDVRRRKEVRHFRAVNFSVAELLEALATKIQGKPLPPNPDWGALVMASLRLTEDLVKVLQSVQHHIPEEVQKRTHIWPGNGNFYARHARLTRRFKATRALSLKRLKAQGLS